MIKRWLLIFSLSMLAIPLTATSSEHTSELDNLFSSDGYRVDRYRSPTPKSITGIKTVDSTKIQVMLKQAPTPIIIDVLNSEYRASRFIESKPHYSIPGAYWLPNTGLGTLDPGWRNYLVKNTLKLTNNNRSYPVIVMCKSDCWLSWNAAKRLKNAGFTQLFWFKDGIDSWQSANLPVERITPVPFKF